ncbi:MAG: TonB-dependent receptor [Parvularculaceae bacterium]|nr:TonB-dependent receptor [Parvularculaceae bacterium]
MLTVFAGCSDVARAADHNRRFDINVEEKTLGAALGKIVAQTGITVLYPYELAKRAGMRPVHGRYTVEEALDALFEGTEFSGGLTENGTVFISVSGVEMATDREASVQSGRQIKRTLLGSAAAFLFGTAGIYGHGTVYAQDEIVVTAQKRAQSLQDAPMAITALTSADISRRSLVGMGDYLNTVPGVTQSDFGVGRNIIVMRGIGASNAEEATVGVYFGEIPLTGIAQSSATDIKLVDIERIEVLRGPQGTLYGSGSMGGTVRNVPKAPNLQEFEGSLEAGYSGMAGGDNSKIVAVLNAPLVEDRFGLRIAAYKYDNAGYVDNIGASDPAKSALAATFGAIVVDEDNVGDTEYVGIRASALWRPVDPLSFTFTYVHQDLTQDGYNEVDPALGGYKAAPFFLKQVNGGAEKLTDDIDIANLVAEYDFGSLSLLSTSTWFKGQSDSFRDAGRVVPLPLPQAFDSGKDGVVQEVRLVSNFDGPFQFLAGYYFEDLSTFINSELFWGGDDALLPGFLGTDPTDLFGSDISFAIKQHAVFGEASLDIFDNLTATVGGRYFDYTRKDDNSQRGTLSGGGVEVHEESGEDGTSFKASLHYKPIRNATFYAQWAQGFRLGRPATPAPAAVCDVNNDGLLDGTSAPVDPGIVRSDKLDSYEIGGKFNLFDQRMTLNVAAYNIEWDGIPVDLFAIPNCGFSVTVNAGEARSRGVEVESTIHLFEGVRLDVAGSYVDAELTKDNPVLGPAGTRLPGSARIQASVGAQYDFTVATHDAYARADYSYVGPFYNDLGQTFHEVGDYHKVNLRAGVNIDQVSIEVYATNLLNADELTYVILPGRAYRLTPRTIGVEIGYRF